MELVMGKTVDQLGNILNEMYTDAPKNEHVTMIHLFGVKYALDIQKAGIREVIEKAGIHLSYKTELSKAVKLAKYVDPK